MSTFKSWLILGVMSVSIFSSMACQAIDNPEAVNYLAAFNEKTASFEAKISQQAQTTQDYVEIYAEYEQFLDGELNRAYTLLTKNLDEKQRTELKKSQRQWLAYRDAEFVFIDSTWTSQNFGSSSALSKGGYRTALIKARVELLFHYLSNF